MKKLLFAAVLLFIAMAGTAFAGEKLNIVATDFPCYDFARQIAGDNADVSMLIRPGVEVHSFEPSPADILAIGEADLFVYIGGESDAWADNILSGFGGNEAPEQLRMIECVEKVENEHDHDHDHDGHSHAQTPEYDEHIWTSPENAMRMVDVLCSRMCDLDGENAQAYRTAADNYIGQIAEIDAAFEEAVENGVRKEIIFGDRFPFIYFTEAYGIEYHAAFESCTAETEPSPMTLMMLIEKVSSEKIPYVYTIEMSAQNVARTISEETGCGIITLHSLQTVTQDEFAAGESYVSIMWKNVEAIRKGLN